MYEIKTINLAYVLKLDDITCAAFHLNIDHLNQHTSNEKISYSFHGLLLRIITLNIYNEAG